MQCPRCMMTELEVEEGQNALSRVTDVYICTPCGMDEAVRDFAPWLVPKKQHSWPVITRHSFYDLVNG
jgi:hypothetical protein